MNIMRRRSWSPYVVGALIGVLSWFTFASVDKPLGITTAFEYTAALGIREALPAQAQTNTYYGQPGQEAGDRLGVDAGARGLHRGLPQLQTLGRPRSRRRAAIALGPAIRPGQSQALSPEPSSAAHC